MQKKILIVEDNDNNMKLFSTLLKCSGYQTLEAHTGSEAIALARQEKPHLILLDIRLSLLNRFETLRMLNNEPTTKHIPSIAITATPLDGKRGEIAKLGFTDCISRQIPVKDFMNIIERYLSG
ncbi:MAG: response regulator [Nitrospirota bacterium]